MRLPLVSPTDLSSRLRTEGRRLWLLLQKSSARVPRLLQESPLLLPFLYEWSDPRRSFY